MREKAEIITSIRITNSIDQRAQKLVSLYRKDHSIRVFKSAILCAAIEKGLPLLEEEIKGKHPS